MAADPRKAIPVPAAYFRAALRRFGATPELRAELWSGADIDEQLLPEIAEVTLFTSIQVVGNMCRVIGEDWPLRALGAWDNAMQGSLEVAARSAPTVRESVDVIARFGHVRGPQLSIRTLRDRSRTTLAFSPSVAMSDTVWRAYYMTAMLSVASMLHAILEGDVGDLVFECSWPAPSYAEALCAALPGTTKFNQPRCAISVPNALCERVSPFADAALYATAVADLERASLRVLSEAALPLRVAQLLHSHKARLSADDAARMLGMSRRTLVRRLAESKASFRALQDAALKQRAQELMAERKLSRVELAEELGFSDPTSFSRARRRWLKEA